MGWDTVELEESPFGKAPEVLDTVNVAVPAARILLTVVMNPIVPVAVEHKTVVGHPAIGVNRTAPSDESLDNRPNFTGAGVLDDLGVHPTPALQDSENRDLGRTPPPSSLAPATKVRLIQFNRTPEATVHRFLVGSDPFPEQAVVAVDGGAADHGDTGCLGRG